jgi:hypothetical protein
LFGKDSPNPYTSSKETRVLIDAEECLFSVSRSRDFISDSFDFLKNELLKKSEFKSLFLFHAVFKTSNSH